MKKKVFGRKLSRDTDSRKALFRSVIKSLIEKGSIKTTRAKAKAVQAEIDKIITLARHEGLSGKRRVYSVFGNDRKTTDALFNYALTLKDRKSGFTRITPLPNRPGDMARLARLEWTEKTEVEEKSKKVKPTEETKKEKAKVFGKKS